MGITLSYLCCHYSWSIAATVLLMIPIAFYPTSRFIRSLPIICANSWYASLLYWRIDEDISFAHVIWLI